MRTGRKSRIYRKNRIGASIALQLNARWLWRLFWIFIRLDILVLLIGLIGLILVGEYETDRVWQAYQQQPEIMLPGLEINRSPIKNANEIILPEFLSFLFDDSPSVVERTIGFLPGDKNTGMKLDSYNVYYARTLIAGDVTWSIKYYANGYINSFVVLMAVMVVFEMLLLISNIFSGARTARKILSPISDLAQQTSGLRYENQEIGARSLQALAGTISSIDADKLSMRIDVENTQEELQELAIAINTMLERIKAAYESQNQFVSDASHELKTPIAVIQGYANLLDRWGKNDENALQESIDAIKSEAERMKHLTNDLLFLARGDSINVKKEIIDAEQLLQEVYRESSMIDSQHRWKIKTPQEKLAVSGDIDLLKQALRVLADNAIKYSPADSDIVLTLIKQNGNVQLSIQDEGTGIPAKDLPQIFDRFFRSDPSRARKTGGSGLGLAIAAWIIEQHNGHFEVISREGIGTRITIVLKAAAYSTNPS